MKKIRTKLTLFVLMCLFTITACTTCLLSVSAAAPQNKVETPVYTGLPEVNFKADYGFTRHSVTKADLGLSEKQYYHQIFSQQSYWDFASNKMDYDAYTAQLALQGLLNREEAALFVNTNTFAGLSSKIGYGDDVFLAYYEDDAKQGLERVELGYLGLAKMIEKFGKYTNGVILYDYDNTAANTSANYVLAYNLANANFCIPVKKDFYYGNIDSFKDTKIVADVSNNGMTPAQIYQWMANNLYGKKGETKMLNKHAIHSINLPFADLKLETAGWANVQGFDYAFKEKVMLFNLPVFGFDTAGSDGDAECDAVLEELLSGLDGKGEPALMLGWNSPEPQWVERISTYGIVVECTSAASNTSFHAAIEPWSKTREEALTEGFTQKRTRAQQVTEYENGKVYIAFLANEGDAMKTRTNLNQRAWNSANGITGTSRTTRAEEGNKEKLPLSWAITASQLKTVPALIEYYYDTATDQDQFYGAPTGGAGYINLGKNPYLDEYISFTDKYFNLLGIEYADFWYADARSIDKYAAGVSSLRGVTLDTSGSQPDGGFHRMGSAGTPGLRYASKRWMWMTRGTSTASNTYWYWDGAENHINPTVFMNDFNAVRKADRPVFIPFYGVEDDAVKLLWDELINSPQWDSSKYQVVDMGNLVELAAKYDADTNGAFEPTETSHAQYLSDATLSKATFWNDSFTNAAITGTASYSLTQNGVRVNAAAENDSLTFNAKLLTSVTGLKFKVSGAAGATPKITIGIGNAEKMAYTAPALTGNNGTFTFDFTGNANLGDVIARLSNGGDLKISLSGGGSGKYVEYESVEMLSSDKSFYTPDLLNSTAGWTPVNNSTMATISGGGIKVTNANSYGLISRNNLKVKPGAEYMKVRLGNVTGTAEGIVKLTGDLNGFGKNEDWARQIGSATGTFYFRLDQRILNQPDTAWQFQLGFNNSGSIELLGLDFITEAQYKSETTEWTIGEPDTVYDDDRYNVDKNNDGIRDGDEMAPITNLRLEGEYLRWDAAEGAERYVVMIYDANGDLINTRVTSATEQKLNFLDHYQYVFKVYGRASGKPNSEMITLDNLAPANTDDTIKPGCGCGSVLTASGIAALAGLTLVLGATLLIVSRRKKSRQK